MDERPRGVVHHAGVEVAKGLLGNWLAPLIGGGLLFLVGAIGAWIGGGAIIHALGGTTPDDVRRLLADFENSHPGGHSGPKGDQGLKGDQGIPGKDGLKGDKGDQGIQGEKGDQGIPGPTGLPGSKGDTGLQGLQGAKGDKADLGSSRKISRDQADQSDIQSAIKIQAISTISVDKNIITATFAITNNGSDAKLLLFPVGTTYIIPGNSGRYFTKPYGLSVCSNTYIENCQKEERSHWSIIKSGSSFSATIEQEMNKEVINKNADITLILLIDRDGKPQREEFHIPNISVDPAR